MGRKASILGDPAHPSTIAIHLANMDDGRLGRLVTRIAENPRAVNTFDRRILLREAGRRLERR